MADTLTPLAVVTLGLLRERSMHPYEMLRVMKQRRDDRLVGGSRGTLYHTVSRLERDGYVAEAGTEQHGNRPPRTTYTITDRGRQAADDWVRRHLPQIDRILEYRVALGEAHDLPRFEVTALLSERRTLLAAHLADLTAILDEANNRGVPLQFLVDAENEHAVVSADLGWLDAFLTRLSDPATPWGIAELPKDTLARLAAFRESVIA